MNPLPRRHPYVVGRLWQDELETVDRPALEHNDHGALRPEPDVLVVGGGVMGVVAARLFVDAGAGEVLLLEAQRQLGLGATGGALGLLTPEPHCGSDHEALVELGRAGLRGWRRLHQGAAEGLGLVDLRWVGILTEGRDPPTSPAARPLSGEELRSLLPWLVLQPPGGVCIDGQARINPLLAVARLAAGLGRIATGVIVTSVDVHGGAIRSVATTGGTIRPGIVVFATGGPPVIDGLEAGVPADVVKGHMVVTERVPVSLGGTVDPLATQLPDGRLAIGGTLDVGDAAPDVRPGRVESMVAGLADWHPGFASVAVERAWTCFRPHHPDGLPVIDRVPGVANAWFTSGHYRTGILMAPATGAVLVEWAASGTRPALAERFGAHRLL